MITLIRNKIMGTHSYFMWAFVIILLLSLAAPSVIRQSSSGGPWIAQVNDQAIGYNTFVRTVQMEEGIARQKYGAAAQMINQKAFYGQALESLIYGALLDQAAAKAGITIAPCYAQNRIADPRFIIPILAHMHALPAYSWHTGIDMRSLRQLLFDQGLTVQDFENEITKTLSKELFQQMVFIAGYSPLFEKENEYKKKELSKTITLVTFPLEHFIAAQVAKGVDKKELASFFEQEKQRYHEPEKRSALVWEFTPKTFGQNIGQSQIESYYAKHKESMFVQNPVTLKVRRILLPADNLQVARDLKKELDEHPDLFADKARAVSKDTESARQGGLLKPFARGVHDKEFDKKVFLLTTPGAISDIITTKDGLEIIQLVERTDKTYKPLSAVQQEIRDILSSKQFHDAFDIESRRIMRQDDIKALDTFIQDHHAILIPFTRVTRDTSPLSQRLFTQKQHVPTSFIEGNKGYIVKITEIEPSFIPPLSQIEARVSQDLFKKRASESLNELLQSIKKNPAAADLSALAERHKASVITLKAITAGDTNTIASYKSKGIPLDEILQLEKQGAVRVAQTDAGGYIARLESVQPYDKKAFETVQDSSVAALNQENMQTTLMGFIASLRRTATIKRNDALLNLRGQ